MSATASRPEWIRDWKVWTQFTYTLLHAAETARESPWEKDSIIASLTSVERLPSRGVGFDWNLDDRDLAANDIKVSRRDVTAMKAEALPGMLRLLFVGTISIAEVLLKAELDQRGIERGDGLRATIAAASKLIGPKCDWLAEAAQKARIVRNCIVHAKSAWSVEGAREMKDLFDISVEIEKPIEVGFDDLFKCRRVFRMLLNRVAPESS